MLVRIGSYIIAFIILATIEFPFIAITMFWTMLMRTMKREIRRILSVPVTFISDIAKVYIAILFATWIIKKIGGTPSWFMFFLPGILMYRNDILRLKRAKSGTSGARAILEHAGEPESYSQSHDIWMERAHLGGDVLGWIVGCNIFLRSAGFF